ncbi:MAG: [protein-PII] uridylyltransferase [Pirellulales bacterium]
MPTRPCFRVSLLEAKRRLAESRAAVRRMHQSGRAGLHICTWWTAQVDAVVHDLYEAALQDLGADGADGLRRHVALVAHGGYGRRGLAPYSDIDLMVLHEAAMRDEVAPLAGRLMQDIYDLGLDLGHSVRTPAEACQLARSDATIYTSLLEARLLVGDDRLFHRFTDRFAKMARRKSAALLQTLMAARREEQKRYGETVYLLQPNIKRSAGGLRDIQLLRWIGFTKFGAAEPEALLRAGALSKQDVRVLKEAYGFLMQLRNEMHFHAEKAADVLDRAEQQRLALARGYRDRGELLAVEQFMREYFRQTSNVRYLVTRFAEGTGAGGSVTRVLAPIFTHQVEGDYRVGQREIAATRKGLDRLREDVGEVLRLADLANLYDKRIAHTTWAAIYRVAHTYTAEVTSVVAQRFLSLMAQPARLGELLRRLHQLRVLEKIVPGFKHARCLLQFNEYHKYTVDEHCLRAVECAASLLTDPGALGHAYRAIEEKRTLHLALLLHDLGKGLPGDHSDQGAEIAETTARRLMLSEEETVQVRFLVQHHLRMSHLAFRRDTSDETIMARFAADVGSPDLLRMLFVMTCADLAAVGPGVLNDWKAEVLTHLFRRSMRYVAGESAADSDRRLEACRRGVLERLNAADDVSSYEAHVQSLPAAYLLEQPPEKVAAWLQRLQRLPASGAAAWGEFLPASGTVEFLVGVDEERSEGLFYKLTGALASKGMTIFSAEIHVLAHGLVLDRFVVEDTDHAGPPPEERIDDVCRALVDAVGSDRPPTFRRTWGDATAQPTGLNPRVKTEVHVDKETSDRYTIVDVFATDRVGLLYTIAKTLFELELSIGVAKIGTYLDQVVDVFYVTDFQGGKIGDPDRMEAIRQRLLAAVAIPDEGQAG